MNNKKITLIKVYENDEDYQYENYFLANITKEEREKILEVCEEIKDLDYNERTKRYGDESVITCIESYIVNNLDNIDFEQVDVDTY